jgi:hypothetical protein
VSDSTYNINGTPYEFRGFGTFSERSADFEIVGRFSGRHLDPEVSLSPPHNRLSTNCKLVLLHAQSS